MRSLVFETCGRLGDEGTKLLRELVTTAEANGQCIPHAEDGEPSWNEYSCLHKQTHTCERWVPELQSDKLLSLLCRLQSRVCLVLFVWRCLHCDSHVKVRLTETETETETEPPSDTAGTMPTPAETEIRRYSRSQVLGSS